jgi:hypothetical protein
VDVAVPRKDLAVVRRGAVVLRCFIELCYLCCISADVGGVVICEAVKLIMA